MSTTTKNQCCAATVKGVQCAITFTGTQRLCAFHAGKEAEIKFPRKVVKLCSATTLKGLPCSKVATQGKLCGTHARPKDAPRKPSSRKGKRTAFAHYQMKWKVEHPNAWNMTTCVADWNEEKAAKTERYQECVALAD